MIRILLTMAVLIAATAFAQRPAEAREAPWCAVLNMGNGDAYWDCQYYSLQECVPNVLAGNRGFCNPNPRYRAVERPRRDYRGRRY
jgi:hypothetical protein